MFNKYKRIVLFDTETSGLSPDNSEIIEFGAVVLTKPDNDSKFTEREDIDVFIKNKYPILNSHIHHITDEICEKEGIDKKDFFKIVKNIFGDYEDTLIVAYNTPFDMKFMKSFMKQIDYKYEISNPTLDLLEVAKDRTGLRRGNKLCDMLVRYEIKDEENSHRAIDDVKATLAVMRAMWKENPNLEEYIKKEN